MIRIHLDPNALDLLQKSFRATSDRRLRDRIQIILLAHRGRPRQAIAADLGINRRGVQRWLNAYLGRGLEGLQPRYAKGRPPAEQRYPGIKAALEGLLSDELALAGSPEGDQKWVRSSAKNLSRRLKELGFDVGRHAVLDLLKRMGFTLRMSVRKRKGLCGDPTKREEQFRYMASQRKIFREADLPMISVDTKKKELIGNFKSNGRVWCREATEVDEYDFASQAECVAVPYGVYDMTRNTGYVVVGLSHNTPEFAVGVIARWWEEEGRVTHAGVNRLLVFADGGGANGSRAKAWKFNLQEKLCDPFQLTVTVCHYPPGCSKWNPIEYRLFSQISKNWEGVPLRTLPLMLGYIRGTTTTTGLTVKASLDEGEYRKGQRVTRADADALSLEPHATLPAWNYTIRPKNVTQPAPVDVPRST